MLAFCLTLCYTYYCKEDREKMNEQKNSGKGIFYGVIGVATLIVAIIGATFAYFTATATNNTTVTGNTAQGAELTLEVQKVTTSATGPLVPLLNSDMQNALTGKGSPTAVSCVDSNGNTVCQVYSITISNKSTTAVTVNGEMSLTTDAANMKWKLITNATTDDADATVNDKAPAGTIVTGQSLSAGDGSQVLTGGSATYYVVVWLNETSSSQDDTDASMSFIGTVTFNAAGADGSSAGGLTATFSDSSSEGA